MRPVLLQMEAGWLWLIAWLWLIVPALLVLGTVGLWLGLQWYARQRGQRMIAALNDSTRGHAQPAIATVQGFTTQLQPAPEPFSQFTISYQSSSKFDPLRWLISGRRATVERFMVRGQLIRRPQAELLWQRGQSPGLARSRGPDATLWMVRHLDVTNAEYAVRGLNPNALIHAFVELQIRFEPVLERVAILADGPNHLEIVLHSGRLSIETIPTLVTMIRAAGRAALIA